MTVDVATLITDSKLRRLITRAENMGRPIGYITLEPGLYAAQFAAVEQHFAMQGRPWNRALNLYGIPVIPEGCPEDGRRLAEGQRPLRAHGVDDGGMTRWEA